MGGNVRDNVIIHVPHASLEIPDIFYEKVLLEKENVDMANVFISDYLVDKFLPSNYDNIVKFGFSRLFCDVERFRNDKLEIMSKYGMGVIYEKDCDGNKFIELDNGYRDVVLTQYYDIHHSLLDEMATNILDYYDKCYIIDLQSFSDEFVKKVLNLENNPDICIGYDDEFCDLDLVDKTINHFRKYGYEVGVNYPYSGSFIPNKYYELKDSRVCSIMIEINKKIYLDSNIKINDNKYLKLKKCMDDYYDFFKEYIKCSLEV